MAYSKNYLTTGTCHPTRTAWVYSCDPAGQKLKISTWGGNNSSGFTALPSGDRDSGGAFGLGFSAHFWSSSINFVKRTLSYEYLGVLRLADDQYQGYSVRCLKN